MRDRALWLSPPVLALLAAALVNAVWLAAFLAGLLWGDAQYVFPKGLRDVIAARLTVRGVDLTTPAVIAYDVALVLGPLVPLLFPAFRQWARREGELAAAWLAVHRGLAVRIAVAAAATAIVFVPLSDLTRLPYTQERVRWATDWFPLPVPIDPPLLVRTEYLLTRVLDARYVFVLVTLAFHGLVAAFLIRAFGGMRAAVPVALAYLAVAANWRSFYFLNGAEAELPAAAFGLMGLVAVTRGRYVGAVWAFLVGSLFKATVLYYAFAATGLVLWWIARRRVRAAELPWGLAVASGLVVLLFWTGLLYNAFQLRGGGYLFATQAYTFVVTPLTVFVADLVANYPAQTALALAGVVWSRLDRVRWAVLAAAILLLRSTAAVAGGYYTTFFIPVIAFLAAAFVVRMWEVPRRGRRLAAGVAAAALAVSVAVYAALPAKSSWISRASSGWDGLIARLERDVPPGATVYFRKVSPRYDLERAGRRDLRFLELSEGEGQVATLSRDGPILYVAPYRDLRGADGPLAAAGYREIAPPFGSDDDPFVVLLKR